MNIEKEKAKDIVFIVSNLGLWVFMVWVALNKDDFTAPYISYPDGTHLSGNCDFVWGEFERIRTEARNEISLEELEAMSLNNSEIGFMDWEFGSERDDIELVPCAIPKPCPECPECPPYIAATTVTPTSCPTSTTIKETSIVVDWATQKKIMNLRCNDCATPYQSSYFKCRKDVMKLLDLPKSS